MLTGELPESRLQPPSRRIQIDVRIDRIVLRALEKTPEMRFATAAEFRTSVETITREEGNRHTFDKRPTDFSRLAVWGAIWAAICLISLPILDMAWVGGFGSTVLGWMAVSEIQRSKGRVRGMWLAVLIGLLFPLLTINAAIVAAYAQFFSPLRNLPYPAMVSPSWPFIIIELGFLTLLFIVLLNFLVVRAVWRRLNKSNSAGASSTLFLSWRMAVGSFLTLPMAGTATLVTREELASVWNQFFCYRTRGPLMLDETTLTHSYAGSTTSIPLETIRDVSIGRLPRLMNPAGLNVLSISYEDEGKTRQVLISPLEGWFQFSQEAVSDWCAAIRKAVVGATGRKPSFTPPEQPRVIADPFPRGGSCSWTSAKSSCSSRNRETGRNYSLRSQRIDVAS